jgi:hypothetical protein
MGMDNARIAALRITWTGVVRVQSISHLVCAVGCGMFSMRGMLYCSQHVLISHALKPHGASISMARCDGG